MVLGGYFIYTLKFKTVETTEAINLIPANAIYFLEAEKPIDNWQDFSSSSFWRFLKKHPYLEEITEDANYLDTLIADNKFLKYFGDRSFFTSAHLTKKNDYDFLFLVDLKKASKFELTDVVIEKILGNEGYIRTKTDFEGYTIVKLYDKEAKDNLYLCQVKNFLVCSYTYGLVKNSILQESDNQLAKNAKYQEVYNRTSNSGIARLYLQYDLLDDYMKIYTTGNEALMKDLSTSFSFTGLDMVLDENEALLEGYTSLPDSVEIYTRLLQEYGNAEYGFQNIISSRTAYAQVIALNKFKTFYTKVLELRGNDPEALKKYKNLKNKVEKILGLSLEKDILAWIGNEIVLAQNLPSKLHRKEDDLVVAIKAYNVDFAKEKLIGIQRTIKRRTPTKFKKMSYKNYDIYYLDINGLFGGFFGKAFDKLTKPYYTIIDEYIVFSNSPKTLVSLVEDYENGNVLANYEGFKRVADNIGEEAALFTYINGKMAYDVLERNIKPNEKNNYAKNKDYFNFFRSVGISYTSKGEGFENKIYMHFTNDEDLEPIPEIEVDSLASEYLEDYTKELEKLSEAETFVLTEVNDGRFVKYFKGTEIVHIEAETKNGKLHGDFLEYYKSGTVRSDGKYRKGRKTGRWKYYAEVGTLEEKDWEGL